MHNKLIRNWRIDEHRGQTVIFNSTRCIEQYKAILRLRILHQHQQRLGIADLKRLDAVWFFFPKGLLILLTLESGRLLQVGVNDADIFPPIHQIVCQKDAECGFIQSAFLISENNDFLLLRFYDFTILL